ncbi:hypothetical protein Y032_0005g2313 [Ancylostoma ceylanicum]|uniref:Uncharacterized protein n=1 Tax=Ancylostoma ceylanicum TaxID=53326 RepID=A0A016VS43_9BILA|nr:hypothetical protein Y032_0005g2313 [Ancylostoma ceylanicum]
MLRLGVRSDMETEADSGHPTPRDEENSTEDDSSESHHCSPSPLTSTPITNRIRNVSVRSFFEGSEKANNTGVDGNAENGSVLVESVRQLIETTRKNRRLTKQNEKFLNESAAWYEEKSFLEKQIKDKDAAAESLRNELREKDIKISALEKRVTDLLRSISEHPVEEVSEAAVELILDKKDAGVQCHTQGHDVATQQGEIDHDVEQMKQQMALLSTENEELCNKLNNLQDVADELLRQRKAEEEWREKCSFMELENAEIRKEEKDLLTEIEEKNAELTKLKSEAKVLNDEVDRLRAESRDSEGLREKNQELEKLLLEDKKLLEEHQLQLAELRSCVASYEHTVQSMKDSEKEMKKQIDDKLVEAEKLDEECRTLRSVGDKLTEESVFATLLNNELKLKLTQAYSDVEELRSSLSKEQEARKRDVESAHNVVELNRKLQESTARIEELRCSNEKMSAELDYLRQKSANSASKQEMEGLSATVAECQRNLEAAVSEKKALLEKEEHYQKEFSKIDSLRFELKSRDSIISDLRSTEEKLQSDLTAKSDELHKLQSQFDELSRECCKLREEYHLFQEHAEQQYCAMLEDKCQQIEAMSARLAQLETYPGQTISIDDASCPGCVKQESKPVDDGAKVHALYDCIPSALREIIEQHNSKDVIAAMKEMQNTFIPIHPSKPVTLSAAVGQDAATSTSSYLEEKDGEGEASALSSKLDDSLPLERVVACFDTLEDYRLHGDSPDLRPELRRLFTCIKYEHDIKAVEIAARHFLESCDRLFLDNAKELFRKEVQNIHDCKDALEKMISSERIQWAVERENMELQLDRFRHQIEQFPNVQKEKAILRSELSATRTQIEQYRLRLRQKCEEVERLEAERDGLTALAKEIQRLDQESQDQIREANTVIDELERKLKDVSADLERYL